MTAFRTALLCRATGSVSRARRPRLAMDQLPHRPKAKCAGSGPLRRPVRPTFDWAFDLVAAGAWRASGRAPRAVRRGRREANEATASGSRMSPARAAVICQLVAKLPPLLAASRAHDADNCSEGPR